MDSSCNYSISLFYIGKIKESLSIPVKYIGLGEQLDDLQEFNLDSYLNGLLGLDEKED